MVGYQIERSIDSGTTWFTVSANTGSTATAYSDIGLAPNTTYIYRVSAVYLAGTSQPSNTASATTTTTHLLTVTSQFTSGRTLTGMYCELRDSSGHIVATGFTPCTLSLNSGKQYTIGMGSYGTYVFDHWLDTGSSVNPRQASISSDTQITAVYRNIQD